jgi:hypothetical protein
LARTGALAAGALAALALPAGAWAHAGGTPVAVDYRARIVAVRPVAPFDVRVVDGDQRLWLRAPARATVVVRGVAGEPFLHFAPDGVSVNERSPTAAIDRIGGTYLAPGPPVWKRLTGGHAYLWHDHRLHALAPLVRAGRTRRWTIAFQAGPRRGVIAGELSYVPGPPLWPWFLPVAAAVALAGACVRWRHGRAVLTALALLAVPAVVVARAGRDLYGRPGVGTWGYVSLGLAIALGAAAVLVLLLARRQVSMFVALLAGVVGVAEGIALLPALDHGLVLADLPAWLERAAVAVALSAGAGACVLYVFAEVGQRRRS